LSYCRLIPEPTLLSLNTIDFDDGVIRIPVAHKKSHEKPLDNIQSAAREAADHSEMRS
jgi:hypothetical protein